MKTPSQVVRSESAIVTGRNPLREWMERVNEADRAQARQMLAMFGLDRIYLADEPLPVV